MFLTLMGTIFAFQRCATTCDQSIVVQGPPTLEGTVDGIYRVFSSTTNGCTTLRITCTGLDPHGMTVLSVALPDDIGVGLTRTTRIAKAVLKNAYQN